MREPQAWRRLCTASAVCVELVTVCRQLLGIGMDGTPVNTRTGKNCMNNMQLKAGLFMRVFCSFSPRARLRTHIASVRCQVIVQY
jgi:hypothetical protein